MLARVAPTDILRIAATLVVVSLLVPAAPDVDLWGHTLFGGEIVSERGLPAYDTYSFTSDVPWVNHEWLFEVAMHGAYALGGGAGLTALRLGLLAGFFAIVWGVLRREGVPGHASVALLTILALLTYARTQHVRPQLASILLFAALLAFLIRFDRRPGLLALAPIPPLMLLWANSHGGFIVGLLPLGAWAAGLVIHTDLPIRERAAAIAVMALGAAATLVNPYGIGLWQFLARTVGLSRADITEWASVTGAEPGFLAIWLLIAAIAVAGVAWHSRPLPLHRVALVAALAFASFRVSRLDAFFATAAVICFGFPLSTYWTGRRRPGVSFQAGRKAAIAVLVLSVCGSGAILLRSMPSADRCTDRAWWLPDQAATAFAMHNQLRGRLAVFFNWGEYAIWQFAPAIEVSIDGRRETVYSERHINAHLELYEGTDAGIAYVRELNPDYVWLPHASPAVNRLLDDGWFAIHRGERSAILARSPVSPDGSPWVVPESSCYPGSAGRPSPLESGLWLQGWGG